MEGNLSLKLTPGQLREILELSQDTFRHWKSALSPLSDRNGYRPCFTPGDLLAVGVVKVLTVDAGVRVGAVSTVAPDLFRLANETAWAVVERSVLIFDFSAGQVLLVAEGASHRTSNAVVQVACRPVVARLRARLLAEQPLDAQQRLQFPPAIVGARTGTEGGQS